MAVSKPGALGKVGAQTGACDGGAGPPRVSLYSQHPGKPLEGLSRGWGGGGGGGQVTALGGNSLGTH